MQRIVAAAENRCTIMIIIEIEMFYLNSTLNLGIPPVLVFQLEAYFKVDRFITCLTAQQKGKTARWYSNKTSLVAFNSAFLRCGLPCK